MTLRYFIDESYNAPIDRREPYFYILGAVGFTDVGLGVFSEVVSNLGEEKFRHASHAALSKRNRDGLVQIAHVMQEVAAHVHLRFSPIALSDKHAEQTRAKLFRGLVSDLFQHGPGAVEVIYDRRAPGFQANADLRVLAESRASGDLPRNSIVVAATPSSEVGIIAADIACWAYRQHFLGRHSDLYQAIEDLIK